MYRYQGRLDESQRMFEFFEEWDPVRADQQRNF